MSGARRVGPFWPRDRKGWGELIEHALFWGFVLAVAYGWTLRGCAV